MWSLWKIYQKDLYQLPTISSMQQLWRSEFAWRHSSDISSKAFLKHLFLSVPKVFIWEHFLSVYLKVLFSYSFKSISRTWITKHSFSIHSNQLLPSYRMTKLFMYFEPSVAFLYILSKWDMYHSIASHTNPNFVSHSSEHNMRMALSQVQLKSFLKRLIFLSASILAHIKSHFLEKWHSKCLNCLYNHLLMHVSFKFSKYPNETSMSSK